MNKDTVRQIAVISALSMTLIVNGLANLLPINGKTTGDVSDGIPSLFTPAGYVFAIWGLIYLGLIAYAVYQALPGQKENPRLRAIGWWFVLSSIANTVWIFLWHYGYFAATLLFMGTLLFSLLVIYQRLEIGKLQVSRGETWAVRVPFGLYLGWITVATIANVSIALVANQWDTFSISATVWTYIMLAVGTLVGVGVAVVARDRVYAAVLVWAFIGIAVKQASITPSVSTAGWIAAAVMAIALVFGPFIGPRRKERVMSTSSRHGLEGV